MFAEFRAVQRWCHHLPSESRRQREEEEEEERKEDQDWKPGCQIFNQSFSFLMEKKIIKKVLNKYLIKHKTDFMFEAHGLQ